MVKEIVVAGEFILPPRRRKKVRDFRATVAANQLELP
jgi:hypothetical protein